MNCNEVGLLSYGEYANYTLEQQQIACQEVADYYNSQSLSGYDEWMDAAYGALCNTFRLTTPVHLWYLDMMAMYEGVSEGIEGSQYFITTDLSGQEMGDDIVSMYSDESGCFPAYDPNYFPPEDNNIYGCTDPFACNVNPAATADDGSCYYADDGFDCDGNPDIDDPVPVENVYGCTDSDAMNYNSAANMDDGSCTYVIEGCTDSTANNFMAAANSDDGSCTYDIYGCTDPAAPNYVADANIDDGSCIPEQTPDADVIGCTDSTAINYNPEATVDSGACQYPDPTPPPVVVEDEEFKCGIICWLLIATVIYQASKK